MKQIFKIIADAIGGVIASGVRSKTIGAGKARALARETAQRVRQAERLKHAEPPQWTRQQRRAAERKDRANIPLTPTQRAYLHMTDQFPTYPRSTFAH